MPSVSGMIEMETTTKKIGYCQYYYKDMVRDAFPDTRLALPVRNYWFLLKRYVWYIAILGPIGFVSRIFPTTKIGKFALKNKRTVPSVSGTFETLNLQPGDWVEVRSVKEIFATLDAQGKLKGLRFTPEMEKFCGKQFKVYKLLGKIILEATGELRKIKTPTVLLEGSFCDGSAHANCDRSCFNFWREQWLKRVSPPINENLKS
jgi:hypothetical protein